MICAKCAILSAISHLCYFSNLNNPKTFFCKVIKKSQCFLFLLSNNKILSLFVVFHLSATIQLALIVIKDEFLRKIFLVQTVVHHNSSLDFQAFACLAKPAWNKPKNGLSSSTRSFVSPLAAAFAAAIERTSRACPVSLSSSASMSRKLATIRSRPDAGSCTTFNA